METAGRVSEHWDFVVIAAALLTLERLSYVWICHSPQALRDWCEQPPWGAPLDPVRVVRALFFAFKVLQLGVFVAWCLVFGDGVLWPAASGGIAPAAGMVLILIGQTFNLSVFRRLGPVGVFYGNRFGHAIGHTTAFPFSLLTHPQYVGTVVSIWGLFLVLRFPHADWMILPAIETVYYAVGARLEGAADRAAGVADAAIER